MPNTGKPSLACHLCRKRRVHCDLTPLGCLRCAKIGKSCPGYRQEQDLLFHNQDNKSFASKRGAGRRREREVSSSFRETSLLSTNDRSPSLSSDTLQLDPADCTARLTPLTLIPQPQEHWHMYCIPIVLKQFSTLMNGVPHYGFHQFLPELYSEINENSCLSFATKVFVKGYLINLSRSPPDKELIHTYGRALWLTNAAIRDPIEGVKDSTVMAVWLLGIHEVVVNSVKSCPVPAPHAYHIHSQGLSSLLRLRGPKQFLTKRGRNLFWIMYLFIQTHCLVSNKKFPSQFFRWLELLRPQLSEDERLVYAVCCYNYQISLICLKIRPYFKNFSTYCISPLQATQLLGEIDCIQNEIQTWKGNVITKPTNFALSPFYNSLRAAQLKLHYFKILLLNCLDSQSMADISLRRKHIIETIEILADEILSEVPATFRELSTCLAANTGCWADGLRLVWPLFAVSWVPYTQRQQREESRKLLQCIGRQTGIRFAFDYDPPLGRFSLEETSCIALGTIF